MQLAIITHIIRSGEESETIFRGFIVLKLSTLGKIFSRRHIELFPYFHQKTGFDISCHLHEMSNPVFWEKYNLFVVY